MSRAVPWILTALGAFIAFILVLNLREKDYYENGSLTRIDGEPSIDPLFRRFKREVSHSCPTCGECTHSVEVVNNRRTLTLRDHDGWYKLFWAADELYYFEELQHLAACYENRTAMDPSGTWEMEFRIGPAIHPRGPVHECTPVTASGKWILDLVVQDYPIVTDVLYTGERARWESLVYPYYGNKLPPKLYFGWKVRSLPNPDEVPCPCGKP